MASVDTHSSSSPTSPRASFVARCVRFPWSKPPTIPTRRCISRLLQASTDRHDQRLANRPTPRARERGPVQTDLLIGVVGVALDLPLDHHEPCGLLEHEV